MVQQRSSEVIRINARRTDVFDIFNLKHYLGSNPYLEAGALVFDFAFTGYREPLAIEEYLEIIGNRYPHLADPFYQSYGDFFARLVSEISNLEMGLHFHLWSVKSQHDYLRIAVQSLHEHTTRSVVFLVWDWLESITKNVEFSFEENLSKIQQQFHNSIYGSPTVYYLLTAAFQKNIPTFYLREEGVIQYGYGKKQVRGIATTFDCDSHLDSEFTTRKDECKEFLRTLGFPVPEGEIVTSESEALAVAREIGYPVAIKPVIGHKGIGVTAVVQNSRELELAYNRAILAIPEDQSTRIIVEKSISGQDFRLLCVNGKFVAATERVPASVMGDGYSTIKELIDQENRKTERRDAPTSPMTKIETDAEMQLYLDEQGLNLDTVIESDRIIYLRKVSNLSAGGISIDATDKIHPDNIILAQEIAQYFRLTCLGLDIITKNLAESWKSGNFAILEINAAPEIFMHFKPAIGKSIDVPSFILTEFFPSHQDARIPIITFNQISITELQAIINQILLQHPHWKVGAVCRQGILINHNVKTLQKDYNSNVQTLLRHPLLDVIIAEYPEEILKKDGMLYYGSNIVILEHPSEIEMMLVRDVFKASPVIIKQGNNISIHRQELIESYNLESEESFTRLYLREIVSIL